MSLSYFTRGSSDTGKKANLEDLCAAMEKFSDMSQEEIKGFARVHDI